MDEYQHPDPDSPYAGSSPEAIERLRMLSAKGGPRAPAAPEAFPGAAVGRLHGRFATLSLTYAGPTTVTLNCFEWEVEVQQEFADATAHGDYWFNPLPITERWTARVRGYLANSSAVSFSSSLFQTANVGRIMTLTCYSDATPTQVIFSGTAYGARGRLLVPDAMVTQEMELTGIGPPTAL
jgi:hypothetical protein